MTATAWLFVSVLAGILLVGVVLERWQRRLEEADRCRRREHARYMDEVRRHGPTIEPRRHGKRL